MRNNFDSKINISKAKRVGYRCSNPNCCKLTSGPQEDLNKSVNIGVAAHINTASSGGPRYDNKQSTDEWKSIENGIWLCQNCSKLIDNDEKRYTSEHLFEWKKLSEQAALLEIQNASTSTQKNDKDIIQNFVLCFDRPAFQDFFHQKGSIEAFDKAIEYTIIAFNTGTLRSRDGAILDKLKGKAFIEDDDLRNQIEVIVDLLRAIRERFLLAVKNGEILIGNEHSEKTFYCFHDHGLSNWFDSTRNEILSIFETVCTKIGIKWKSLFPRPKIYW